VSISLLACVSAVGGPSTSRRKFCLGLCLALWPTARRIASGPNLGSYWAAAAACYCCLPVLSTNHGSHFGSGSLAEVSVRKFVDLDTEDGFYASIACKIVKSRERQHVHAVRNRFDNGIRYFVQLSEQTVYFQCWCRWWWCRCWPSVSSQHSAANP